MIHADCFYLIFGTTLNLGISGLEGNVLELATRYDGAQEYALFRIPPGTENSASH